MLINTDSLLLKVAVRILRKYQGFVVVHRAVLVVWENVLTVFQMLRVILKMYQRD